MTNDQPENTTYIARTPRGWAASPNPDAAMTRALKHTRPDDKTDIKIEVFEVDAENWTVDGMGAIKSPYCEEHETIELSGKQARKVCDKYNEILDILTNPKEVVQ